jgi:hypothetical protein
MIPFATTTLTVLRDTQPDAEPYQEPAPRVAVASGVRAVLNGPTGNEVRKGGEQQTAKWHLYCDVADIDHRDYIRDDSTGTVFYVIWVGYRPSPIEHIEGELGRVEGLV